MMATLIQPTHATSVKSIYGDHASDEPLPETAQQAIVGTLTILLFVFMAMELTSPEVLFLIALIIVILCEILTIKEGLAGKLFLRISYTFLLSVVLSASILM